MKKEYAESSLSDACRYFAQLTNGKVSEGRNAEAFMSNVEGFTWYNRTVITGDFDIQPGTPLVGIADYNSSKEIVKKIKSFGYSKMIDQTGMLFDLTKYEGTDCVKAENGAVVERIGAADIDEWIGCLSAAFPKPPEVIHTMVADAEDLYFYACKLDGRIIGTVLLYVCEDNAGIHEVSVLSEYRRQGLGELLLNVALTQAKKMGATVASLQASELGKMLYTKLGFEEVSIIANYVLNPPA